LVRHPNIHADTSGVRRFDLLEQAIRRAGAAKILFGTDGPWLHPGVELAKVRALGLSPSEQRLVVSGNLLRLIARAGRRPPIREINRMELQAPLRPVPDPERGDPWLLTGEAH
jgi:hypothetical protein